MNAIDLTEAYEKYKGLWVAFTEDFKVISADKDIRKVTTEAKQKGYKLPLLMKMPQEMLPMVG